MCLEMMSSVACDDLHSKLLLLYVVVRVVVLFLFSSMSAK